MKKFNIIIIVVFIVLILAAVAVMNYNSQDTVVLDEYTTIIGNDSNGTVYKIVCGNNSSEDTAIVILGVHSLESGIHNATNETIMKFTKENSLNKKFIVYFIKLNFKDSGLNTSDYDTNRHMGEILANKYVVPDIENYNPYVVVDVHEMEDYWENQRYIGVFNNQSVLTMDYAYRIADNLNYPIYEITGGTSPQWVTIPIWQNNHTVLLFETAQADNQSAKTETAINLVRSIDDFPIY